MKSFTASLILLLTCTGVRALNCHTCIDTTDTPCTGSVTCASNVTMCLTLRVTATGEIQSSSVTRSCDVLGICSLSMGSEESVDLGFARVSAVPVCCDTDDCNNQTAPEPNTAENDLSCFSCANSTVAANASLPCNTTIRCRGNENRCFNGTAVTTFTDPLRAFGCASENVCGLTQANLGSLVPPPFRFNSSFRCCDTSCCNSAWTSTISFSSLALGALVFLLAH